jgi:hypothetical protein
VRNLQNPSPHSRTGQDQVKRLHNERPLSKIIDWEDTAGDDLSMILLHQLQVPLQPENDCPHGHMIHDRSISCYCFFQHTKEVTS